MATRRRVRALIVGAAVAAAAACSDGLNPFDPADVYVLRTVGGEPLPALGSQHGDVTVHIVADTLRLRLNGSGSHSGVQRIVSPGSGPDGNLIPQSGDFTYEQVGDRVEITFACPPNALCIRGPHIVGRLVGDILEVELSLGLRVPQIFERVSD